MDEETQKLLAAFRRAQASGNPETAQRIADLIRQRASGGGAAMSAAAVPEKPLKERLADIQGVDFSPAEVRALQRARKVGNKDQIRNITGRAIARFQFNNPSGLERTINTVGDMALRGIVPGAAGARTPIKLIGGRTEAALRGVGSGAFGLGDLLATISGAVAGGTGLGESSAVQRGRKEELASRFPLSGAVGFGAGALGSGGAAAKLAGAGLKASGAAELASRIPGAARVRAALTPAVAAEDAALSGADKLRNLAIRSAGGAGVGGAAGGVEGLNTGGPSGGVKGAVGGAIGGAVAVPVVGGIISKGGPAVTRIVGGVLRKGRQIGEDVLDVGNSGFKVLARLISKDVNPDELRRAAAEFKTVTGQRPNLAQIIGSRANAEVGDLLKAKTDAQQLVQDAADKFALGRQKRLELAIPGGKVKTTPDKAALRRTLSINAQFKKIENIGVPTSKELIAFAQSPDVRQFLSPQARKVVARAAQHIADNKPVTRGLTLRDIEDIRQGAAAAVNKGEKFKRFSDLRDTARAVGTAVDKRFGTILDEFARRSDVENGLLAGREALGRNQTSSVLGGFSDANPAVQAGTRVGARTALTDMALESSTSARDIAKRLAEDNGLNKRLQTILRAGKEGNPSQADKLRQIGRIETTAARGFDRLTGRPIQTRVSQQTENLKEATQSVVFSSIGAGGAAKASLIDSFLRRFQISPRIARQLAKDVLDPNRVDDVIARLKALKASDKDITDIFNRAAKIAAPAAGVVAGTIAGAQQQ